MAWIPGRPPGEGGSVERVVPRVIGPVGRGPGSEQGADHGLSTTPRRHVEGGPVARAAHGLVACGAGLGRAHQPRIFGE